MASFALLVGGEALCVGLHTCGCNKKTARFALAAPMLVDEALERIVALRKLNDQPSARLLVGRDASTLGHAEPMPDRSPVLQFLDIQLDHIQ